MVAARIAPVRISVSRGPSVRRAAPTTASGSGILSAMLVTLLSLLALPALPQGGEADPPVGLTIVVADVGQGDGVVIRSPDGLVHCYDAGKNGQGAATILPLIQTLQPAGDG